MNHRILEFDYLRGIAILYILLGHSIYNSNEGFPVLLENLLRGGTGVFVFVSGFFFHRVFYRQFEYRSFMVKKIQNVFVPFLVISAVAIVLQMNEWLFIHGNTWDEALVIEWKILRDGYVLFPHWYIPFIMLTFLLSPWHKAYIEKPLALQLGLLALSSVVAVFLQRGADNGPIQSLFYFTPFYLLGILYSQYQGWFERNKKPLLMLCAVLVLVALYMQTYVFFHVGNYHNAPLRFRGVDWQFIQKMAICLLLLELSRWMVGKPGADHLHFLARISFALFFLHPFLTMVVADGLLFLHNVYAFDIPHNTPWSMGMLVFLFLFLTYGTVGLILLLKRWLGNNSRWVMGW
ncbi:acyltransferase [Pokkaliibacter plantistimulans]|uniref:acyltransferase n=1 Tax=Pokkaliibacter plantistimulans TaxID=1635171 RepID=UPI0026B98CD9|nr:acyltransferase [Pokkaliibacter plantistimulans]